MRIEVDDVHFRILLENSFYRCKSNEMFASEHDGQLAVIYDLTSLLFNVLKRIFGRAEAELQVAAVEDFKICQVLVLIRAVCLDSEALVTDGGTSESRARPEARRGIKGAPNRTIFDSS